MHRLIAYLNKALRTKVADNMMYNLKRQVLFKDGNLGKMHRLIAYLNQPLRTKVADNMIIDFYSDVPLILFVITSPLFFQRLNAINLMKKKHLRF